MKTLRSFAWSGMAALLALLATPACAAGPAPAAKAAKPVPVAEASDPAQTAATNDNTARPATPALWKVADEDTTIYVFGTIHVLPAGVDWFDGKVAAAFGEAGELVTEIVEDDPARMQGLVIDKALLPQGQTLRALLGEEQRSAYDAVLAQYGIPATLFDRFELWYAAVGLSTLPLMNEGFNADNGVEKALELRATARKMPHEGLETPEFQLDLFDRLPVDVQRRYFGEVIEQLPKIKDELKQMVEAWRTGDAETLVRLMNAEKSDPVLVKTLLIDRNATWAEWVDDRLDEPGTVFLAVGAGHLAGPGSLQDKLAERDIATERLQ